MRPMSCLKYLLLVAVAESRPNILIMLADDLGIGDTSVRPFVGTGVKTPELEKMAERGTIMTNFHSAAPICTPARAAILTGIFPWRFGIAGVYDYGSHLVQSNLNDWLPQVVPTKYDLPFIWLNFSRATGNYFCDGIS